MPDNRLPGTKPAGRKPRGVRPRAGKTARASATSNPPMEVYRVEGIGRRGVIRYVKVVGHPGAWRITGLGGLKLESDAGTVADAVRRLGRKIPFRTVVIRPMLPDSD